MFSGLTYFFDHSIYFARLCHVNSLCKHEYAFLQMKETPNQKVQEKKPLLKFKNTKKYICLERIWRKKCFWACRHRPLLYMASVCWTCYLFKLKHHHFRNWSVTCLTLRGLCIELKATASKIELNINIIRRPTHITAHILPFLSCVIGCNLR